MDFIKSWIYAVTYKLWGKSDADIDLELLKLQIKKDVESIEEIISAYNGEQSKGNVKSIKGDVAR